MSRLYAPLAALLVLIACSVGRPLYEPGPTSLDEAPPPVAGGKGFVSSRADAVTPPMSLTASDGSGLRLLSLQANAMVDDPLATTEMELRFLNPKNEITEGKFELVLPPGASITRFAMMVGDTWQEAEVVERQKGRQVYESFLYQDRDPALLEQETGNRFSVRVFPIPAAGESRLRVGFVQAFDEPELPYRLALRGLPRVDEIDVRVGVKQASGEVKWTERRVEQQRPREDVVVARDAAEQAAWRAGTRVIARVTIPADERETKMPASFAILFDTSASRAIDFASKVEQLREVVEQLGRHVAPAAELVVLPFDQAVGAPVYAGPLAGFADSDAPAKILRRRPLGASDLELALLAAAEQGAERVIVITDGMITAGERDPNELRKALRRVSKSGTRRLDVIAGRDRRDDEVLRTLVTAELPQSGVAIDAARSPEDIAVRLMRPTAPPTTVRIAGASKVWPAVLRGVQAGDAVLVYAELDHPRKELAVTLDAAGTEPVQQRIALRESKNRALTQAWVRADVGEQLAALAATGDSDNAALRKQLADLSVEHRILNDLTAFIVLETEQDYAQFGIDRKREPGEEALAQKGAVDGPPPAEPQPRDRTVRMEEYRNLPVGNSSSREFTSVVERSATASRDSAGVSLAGTSSAESRYNGSLNRPLLGVRKRPPKLAEVTLRSVRARRGLDPRDAQSLGTGYRHDVERCFFAVAAESRLRSGSIAIELHIDAEGEVERVELVRKGLALPPDLRQCMDRGFRSRRFEPGADGRRARYTFVLRDGIVPDPLREQVDHVTEQLVDPDRFRTDEATYEGNFAEVKRRLRIGEVARASSLAWAWRRAAPDDIMALVAVGEVAQAQGHNDLAARAFGSIAELHPSNAAMLRFAAGRLEAVGRRGLLLAIDTLEEAQRQRPDHPTSHRALAWALAERGRFAEAFDALARGYDNAYPDGRFESARAELGEELRIVAAAWVRAQPRKRSTIDARLAELGLARADRPSLRFVLTWETDTNDVDLHIQDGDGGRAWYSSPNLKSGGSLLADVTTGFGPESFVIDGEADAYPYYLAVHYYSRGPMGYGMGQVQVIHHDGAGKLDIETLPFVTMKEDAKLLLGAIHGR